MRKRHHRPPLLPGEEWRPVPGYENWYEVSNLGRVRTITIACPWTHQGYPFVSIGGKKFGVHRLVALVFHGPRPEGQEVRHLNGIRTDNRAENLAYGTRMDNVNDAKRHGTLRHGEGHWNYKLTDADIEDMIRLYGSGATQAALSRQYGVSPGTVCQIVNRQKRTYVRVIAPLPTDSLPNEEWRNIKEADGSYDVSNLGRVRSYHKQGGGRSDTPIRILRHGVNRYGYETVGLRTGRGINTLYRCVHRLVADQFVGQKPSDDMVVCHIDGNRRNNRADNLAWGTQQDNADDRKIHHDYLRGAAHPMARMSEADVLECRRLRKSGMTYQEIANRFGVCSGTVQHICAGRTWGHLKDENGLLAGTVQ